MKAYPHELLGEFFRIRHGYAFKGEHFASEGEYILLTPGNFEAHGGLKLKGDKEKYYVGEIPADFVFECGDLVVAMTDLTQNAPILGAPAMIPESTRFLHNQRLGKIVDLKDKQLDKNFLFYLLNLSTVREQIKSSATGATVKHTAPDRIYSVRAPIPPLATQHHIASILSAYDDLIENNTKRIKVLEEMARSLYREWFVFFRFPGHEKVKMVDSALGKVPEGWNLAPLTQIFDIRYGKTLPKMQMTEDGKYPVYGAGGSIGRYSEKNIDSPTALITSRGAGSGTVWRAREIGFVTNNSFIVLPKDSTPLRDSGAIELFLASANITSVVGGAAQPQLTLDGLSNVIALNCPKKIGAKFDAIIASLYALCDELSLANTNLRQTRDLLLPRLISGEIDVSDVKLPG